MLIWQTQDIQLYLVLTLEMHNGRGLMALAKKGFVDLSPLQVQSSYGIACLLE